MNQKKPYHVLGEVPGRLYAIGDIHGCFEELKTLLGFLEQDLNFSTNDRLVFIGDYIDRGPASCKVIDTLIDFRKRFPETLFLKGNHEEMMLGWLGIGAAPGAFGWFSNGGDKTVESYGLAMPVTPSAFANALSQEQIDFFAGLESCIVHERYIFAHAGLNPLKDITQQDDDDLLWIRGEFINNIHHHGKIVIFGHTPFQNVVFHLPWKISVDTGLVYGNMLTCLDLSGGNVLQIKRNDTEVIVSKFNSFEGGQEWKPAVKVEPS